MNQVAQEGVRERQMMMKESRHLGQLVLHRRNLRMSPALTKVHYG
ncbi:hypothetical protein PC116_g29083 [Phytophthora cactorum]|nr:hypothetical protein PC116_g29083 [Phytophthora cactorum]